MSLVLPSSVVQGTIAQREHVSHDGHLRILIVDDCRLRRESVTEFLIRNAVQVSRAWDMNSLCEEFERCGADVILVNMATYGAESLLRRSVELRSASKVLAFGLSEDDEDTVVQCVEAGVGGYHLRSESLGELLSFIHLVHDGETACSPVLSAILLRRVSELATRRASANDSLLTAREDEVLEMLAMGLSNREIASRLCIAVHTVKNHVHNLLTKLGARSRAEAVAIYRGNHEGPRRRSSGVLAVLPSSRPAHGPGAHGSNSPYTARAQ